MKTFFTLCERNMKLFFKDKGLFLTSLITPIILLVLYIAFLANVYRDSMMSAIPEGFVMPEKLINGIVGGQLFSSLLAVSTVTVTFCANMIMVQDKLTGAANDFSVTPLKKPVQAMAYFLSTMCVALVICVFAMAASMIYLACVGWYLSAGDVFLLLLDTIILTLFGTALSSLVNCFAHTQGQMQAVGTIVSAGYGFICGAYMPLSNLGSGLQKAASLLPGTYGTALFRNHAMRGAFEALADSGVPNEVVKGIKDSIDCNLYFFGDKVSIGAMYGVVILFTVLVIGAYILSAVLLEKKKTKKIKPLNKPFNFKKKG
ncbi:MAG: ABC transporter permease [Clostridiales bacterium]|nr:ABC transporter permease [Clostridiales bacterium]